MKNFKRNWTLIIGCLIAAIITAYIALSIVNYSFDWFVVTVAMLITEIAVGVSELEGPKKFYE